MKPFIPTEDEFETILSALGSYEKERVTGLIVGRYLKKMEGLTNEEAFVKAFSKEDEKAVYEEVGGKAKDIRDKVVVVQAKVIQFRDFIREQQTADAIDSLIQ